MCFFIPILFTQRTKNTSVDIVDNNNLISNLTDNKIENNMNAATEYDYKNYNVIKLYHSKTDSIEEINLDVYLYGVVCAEMPASFEKEALKAQAIVARTYTIYKIQNNESKHGDAGICDDSTCCQAWISKEERLSRWEDDVKEDFWNKIVEAVDETKGKIVTYEGEPINAFFHSNSGGKTEPPINVWGGSGYPYLQTVETWGEESYSQYYSEVEYSKQTFIDKIREKHREFEINFDEENCIQILEYTEGDRVKTIKLGNIELSGVEVRTLLGLKSANFFLDIKGDTIKISVKGYGHGVGMSQTGADSLAKQGKSCEEIIKHFYTGVEISNV